MFPTTAPGLTPYVSMKTIMNILVLPSRASGLTACVAIGVGSTIPNPCKKPGTANPEYLESH